MSNEFSNLHMKSVLDRAVDMIDQRLKEISDVLGDPPLGMKRSTDREVVEQFNGMVQAFPPELIMLPDGTSYVESPMVLALQTIVSGGKEFMARYRKAMKTLPLEEIE